MTVQQEPVKLVFKLPTKDSPGFMRRMKRFMGIAAMWDGGRRDPQLVDEMITFFADYVVEPPTREQAIDALWDASETQINELMEAFQGNAPSPAEPSSA